MWEVDGQSQFLSMLSLSPFSPASLCSFFSFHIRSMFYLLSSSFSCYPPPPSPLPLRSLFSPPPNQAQDSSLRNGR